jgi:hypothetical protein
MVLRKWASLELIESALDQRRAELHEPTPLAFVAAAVGFAGVPLADS